MERVYWRYKLDESYYPPQSLFFYFIPFSNQDPLNSLLFYQDEPSVLKELYTDTVIDFTMRHATVIEHGKERDIYAVNLQIPETNVYYSRTLHYLNDQNQKLVKINESELRDYIGSKFSYRFRLFGALAFDKKKKLVNSYFQYLRAQKQQEDDYFDYIIKNNKPRSIEPTWWDQFSKYLFFFSPEMAHQRKDDRMKRRTQKEKEKDNQFVKRFFEEYKD